MPCLQDDVFPVFLLQGDHRLLGTFFPFKIFVQAFCFLSLLIG